MSRFGLIYKITAEGTVNIVAGYGQLSIAEFPAALFGIGSGWSRCGKVS
jgi:hypothetical protein